MPGSLWLLCLAKAMRTFAFGATSVVLALYLASHGFNPAELGAVFSATLIEDAILTTIIAFFAPRLGMRNILLVSAVAIVLSGALLSLGPSKWLIVAAIVFGIMSPGGFEGGPFGPIEQTIASESVPSSQLTRVLSFYNLAGFTGAAFGSLVAGLWVGAAGTYASVLFAPGKDAACNDIFVLYSAIGIVLSVLYCILPLPAKTADYSGLSGLNTPSKKTSITGEHEITGAGLGVRIGAGKSVAAGRSDAPGKSVSSGISNSTYSTWRQRLGNKDLNWLAGLQSVDAFGGGFVVQSLLTFWFLSRYHCDAAYIGTIFFVTNIFAAASFFAAPYIARRFGLLRTMVFTHLPCSMALCLMPFMPDAHWAGALLVLRSLFSSLDIPARQAYAMLIVAPEERSYAAALTTSSRAIAQGLSPAISGWALANVAGGLPFIFAGVLKSLYDIAIFVRFAGVPLERHADLDRVANSKLESLSEKIGAGK